MTREEEIKRAALDCHSSATFIAFVRGAKWADNNPKNDVYRDANGDVLSLEEIEKRYKQGVKHRKQKIIDKACEWIKNNKHLYKVLSFGSLSTDWDKFIREFRKAMEE